MLSEAVVSILGQEICCTEVLLVFVSFSPKKRKSCLEITHITYIQTFPFHDRPPILKL